MTVLWPPKPKELEMEGPGSHGRTSVTMSWRGISGSWLVSPMLVGSSLRRIASTTMAASIDPEAPRPWPVEPLIEETAGCSSPNIRWITAPSVLSLSSVPVPWALM